MFHSNCLSTTSVDPNLDVPIQTLNYMNHLNFIYMYTSDLIINDFLILADTCFSAIAVLVTSSAAHLF